jgi:hypothetical protein
MLPYSRPVGQPDKWRVIGLAVLPCLNTMFLCRFHPALVASVAQLVEQLTLNQLVLGSSPSRGTNFQIESPSQPAFSSAIFTGFMTGIFYPCHPSSVVLVPDRRAISARDAGKFRATIAQRARPWSENRGFKRLAQGLHRAKSQAAEGTDVSPQCNNNNIPIEEIIR